MQITIQNKIQIDDDVELIHETHTGDLVVKGDWLYLIYHNSEGEKVIIKLNANELLMTRYSTPLTQLRLVAGGISTASIPTPMGIQQLVTNSRAFSLSTSQQTVLVSYDLLPSPEAQQPFASYELHISWQK